MNNFFLRQEEKRDATKKATDAQKAERQRVLDALAQYGRVPLAQFARKGLCAAVVVLERQKLVRRFGGNELGEGASIEVVS